MRAEHLYIHVPFCSRRCVYCDFSIAVRARVPVEEFVAAVAGEWDLRHDGAPARLETVYLGGGTPSRLGGDGIARLLDDIRARAEIGRDAEVTMECNPEDVNAAAVAAWHRAGINRLSVGTQSFDDRVLRWMHRTHDAAEARRAVYVARDGGLDNLSIDLIFGTTAVPERSWRADIEAALALAVPHVSVYGLTVEPSTPLGRWVARRSVRESSDEDFETDFLLAHDCLVAAGLEHYEVSNYGRPGRHSRHNWAYWHRRPYVGLGPSAHEFDGFRRRWNVEAYARWSALVSRKTAPTAEEEELTPEQVSAEIVYLGLRTSDGLALTESECEHTRPWVDAGWATNSARRLRLTPSGWLRLDALAADLTHFRSR